MNIKPGEYYVCSCGNSTFSEVRELILSRKEDPGAYDLTTVPATPLQIKYEYYCTKCNRRLERKHA